MTIFELLLEEQRTTKKHAFLYRIFMSVLVAFQCCMTAFSFGAHWHQVLSVACTVQVAVFYLSQFFKLHWED